MKLRCRIFPGCQAETDRQGRLWPVIFIRMLFSCLVDGDYLDTEQFMLGQDAGRGDYDCMDVLQATGKPCGILAFQ